MRNLSSIVETISSAPRMGSAKDDPEGARYIQISDTLAREMTKSLMQYRDAWLRIDEILRSFKFELSGDT